MVQTHEFSAFSVPLWTIDLQPPEVEAVWLRRCVEIEIPGTSAQDVVRISLFAAKGASSSCDIMLDEVNVSYDVCQDYRWSWVRGISHVTDEVMTVNASTFDQVTAIVEDIVAYRCDGTYMYLAIDDIWLDERCLTYVPF
ncbi:hypothetical protein DPMN_147054 [Dreissena polymorpha]|uniref:Uncharacterized protein n=1 Tax=Dreissena polymorpha TaxID=45954 RepID=A0A9D4F744_DREPO|nr:hypothetical protein DPMN_147054 [Dreissena polymorpha]